MPRLHRVVRKAPPPTSASFDEQLWPVAIALVVLAGFLIGVSLAYQPLTGVPWHRTAWPSVIGIPLVVAAALAALIRIDSRSFRRSLQLSLILCAILHVALVIQMLETRMFAGLSPAAVQRQKREIIERRPLKIVPDYHPTVLVPEEDRPRQDFEKPVPTQSPELTHEPEKFLRQSSPEDQSPQVPQPVPMLDPQPTTEPNVIDRRQANEVAPRLAAQPSRLSRQVAKAAARATQSIEMPAAATASQSATNVQPAELPIERSQAESVSAARPAAEPSTTATTAANAPIRATRETLPAESAAAQSALARSPAPPPASRSARATAIEAPATVAQNNPPSLEPFSTAATRAPAASAATARPVAEPPALANRAAPSQSIAQAKAAPDRTNPAAANPADVARQAAPRQPAVANVQPAAAALPAAPSVVARPMTEVRPNAATIARTAASASAAQPSATSPEAASAAARELSATSNTRALAPDRSVASLNPPSPQATAPRRAVATAPQPSSPTTIDSPAVAVAPASETAAAARRMALSKAQGGSVGAGRSPNVESAAPGGASPALVASGSMNRAEATQRSSSAEALAPSAASRLPRSRAEAAIATAPVRTQPLDAAGVAGATQVAEVTASSGAALTSARSGAKSGAIAADKGTSQIDLGPTQRVAEAGIGRAASGGGQAELALQSPAPQLARQSVSGGAPQMSLAAATVGEVAAPAASGGAAPPATASAAALPATRGAGGEGIAAAASVGPARADAATGEPSANLVAAAVSRRETSEAEIAASSPGSNATDDKNPRLTRAAVSGQASAIDRTAEQIAVSGGARATVQPTALAASDVGSPRPAAAGRGEGPAANRPRIGDESAGSPLGEVGSAIAVRPTKTGDVAAAPDAAIATNAGNVARRAAVAASGAVSTQVAAIPEVGPSSAVAQAEVDHLLSGGAGQSPMSRRADNALTIEVQASAGPGGLGADYTPEVGINTRQSRADSLNVQLRSARFVRTQIGGVPAISTSAIVSSEAFSSRGARTQGDTPAGGRGTPEPQTEEAIERGLAFLVRFQLPDGGWSLQGFPEGAELASDTAATALAVIAFQGAGYHHREFHYKDVVRGGIDALLKGQKTNGDLFVPLDDASNRSVWLYSHSLAAIALCEAYGMTQDPALREPAQKAVEFVIAAQQPERGGWRYAPGVGADTSVSGWMMMALKSGELAGLNVPGGTYDKINRWLDDAQQSPAEPHLYRYNPFAPDTSEQRHGRAASKTMTAVGLLMRLYSGWRRDNPNMIRGAAFLSEHLPAVGTVREPERDTYYWYYATQVMAHMGGEHWQRWIAKLHPLLIESQVRQGVYAGSWDPLAGVPDRWGPHAGRLYVTALNLLSLEVQYRKLPLYDDAIR